MTTAPVAAHQKASGKPAKTMIPDDSHAPQDYILRIREEPLNLIKEGKKNYEYREYALREEIKRVWLYEDGTSSINLVLIIGEVRTPGQVNDPRGEGNNKFDANEKVSKFGYPIIEVLRLPHAITKKELMDVYGTDMEGGRQYVKKTMTEAFPISSLPKVVMHEHKPLTCV